MLIVVTGEVGIGKSTVCRKVINLYRGQGYDCGGVISYKDGVGDIIAEDIFLGTTVTLASRRRIYNGPQVGAYFFNPDGIAFGMEALNRAVDLPLIVVDEIGPLELAGDGFSNSTAIISQRQNGNCIVVIRNNLLHSFLPRLGGKPLVFETTTDNRDAIPSQIGQIVCANTYRP